MVPIWGMRCSPLSYTGIMVIKDARRHEKFTASEKVNKAGTWTQNTNGIYSNANKC